MTNYDRTTPLTPREAAVRRRNVFAGTAATLLATGTAIVLSGAASSSGEVSAHPQENIPTITFKAEVTDQLSKMAIAKDMANGPQNERLGFTPEQIRPYVVESPNDGYADDGIFQPGETMIAERPLDFNVTPPPIKEGPTDR